MQQTNQKCIVSFQYIKLNFNLSHLKMTILKNICNTFASSARELALQQSMKFISLLFLYDLSLHRLMIP